MGSGARRARVAFAAVVAALGIAGAGSPAPAATASAGSYVVMYSDGDWVGGGTQRVFNAATNSSISVTGTLSSLEVDVSGGSAGDYYTLDFAASPGSILASGTVYTNAQRAPFREAGHPGIDIYGSGRGCNTDTGRFEVKDIGLDADGYISQLWIVYEQHCEGGRAALWGEVKIGEPAGPSGVAGEAGIVRWPTTDVSAPNTVVPVTLEGLGASTSVTGAAVAGTNAGDFAIRSDECTGTTLAAGSTCQIWLRFVAAGAGTRTATLHVTTSGSSLDVPLQGFAYGGTTSVSMTSDQGDYIGQGRPWSYSIAGGDGIGFSGNHQLASFGLNGANGDWWSATFQAPQGDVLVAGTTYQATRYPFNGTGGGLDVSGEGRGCNTLTGTFTVNSVSFAPDGTLKTGSFSFIQHCEGAGPAFRGTWAFRAGDNTAPAAWMVGSPPVAPAAPTITSFTPASGVAGDIVTVRGTSFGTARTVTIGGTAASFQAVSENILKATVPDNAASGPIAVTNATGTATSTGTFRAGPPPPPPPTIGSFSPTSGAPGTTVTITGTNFTGATGVAFAGTSAVFSVVSANQITTSVPQNAATGKLTVTTPGGTGTSASDFTVPTTSPPPTISSFSPAAGQPGTTVTITGSNFTGATAVAFGGTSAVFNVVSATRIDTSVPQGAVTGPISVTTSWGTAASASSFDVSGPPTVSSFSPTAGQQGATITVTGTNFTGATSVTIGGASAVFNVVSSTRIDTAVPQNAASGKIAITTPAGTATSTSDFTVVTAAPVPSISSFTPVSGGTGTTVTIAGANFGGTSSVAFNGVAAVYSVASSSQITATVPRSATSGKITVVTPGGTATSASDFTVSASSVPPPDSPTIASFSPTSGEPGATVTITGTNLANASDVKFNGVTAAYTVTSATQITTAVPQNATSGKISVTTPGGTATSAGDFAVTAPQAPPPPPAPPAPAPPPSTGGGGGSSGIPPDLHVDVVSSAQTAPAIGAELDYAIVVSSKNAGGSSETTLRLTLPAGYTVTGVFRDRGPGCTGTAPDLTCNVAFINSSASTHLRITGTVGVAGEQDLTAIVNGYPEPEFDMADNTVTLRLLPSAPTSPSGGSLAPPTVARSNLGTVLRPSVPSWGGVATHLRYQWELCTASSCRPIRGAVHPALRLIAAYAGKSVRRITTATVKHRTVKKTSTKTLVRA